MFHCCRVVLWCAVFSALVRLLGAEEVSFHRVNIAAGPAPIVAQVEDVNGDGFPDVISGRSDLTIYLNDGSSPPQFSPVVVASNLGTIHGVKFMDVDDDSFRDLVVVLALSPAAGRVEWYRNLDGLGGSWSPPNLIDFQSGDQAEFLAVGDLNGDSIEDLAVPWNNGVSRYLRTAPGMFSEQSLVFSNPVDAGANSVSITDLNGDSIPDMVVGFGLSNRILWFEGPNYDEHAVHTFPPSQNVSSIAVADLDGDNDVDVASISGGSVEAWHPQTSGVLFGNTVLNTTVGDATEIAAVDVEGDGDPDLVVLRDGVRWWENDGAGNFVERFIDNPGGLTRAGEPGDVDGDGRTDVVVGLQMNDGGGLVVYLQDDHFVRSDSMATDRSTSATQSSCFNISSQEAPCCSFHARMHATPMTTKPSTSRTPSLRSRTCSLLVVRLPRRSPLVVRIGAAAAATLGSVVRTSQLARSVSSVSIVPGSGLA